MSSSFFLSFLLSFFFFSALKDLAAAWPGPDVFRVVWTEAAHEQGMLRATCARKGANMVGPGKYACSRQVQTSFPRPPQVAARAEDIAAAAAQILDIHSTSGDIVCPLCNCGGLSARGLCLHLPSISKEGGGGI